MKESNHSGTAPSGKIAPTELMEMSPISIGDKHLISAEDFIIHFADYPAEEAASKYHALFAIVSGDGELKIEDNDSHVIYITPLITGYSIGVYSLDEQIGLTMRIMNDDGEVIL